jgi:putative ABC transport system permease protein
MENLLQDLRLALRRLHRSPGFTIVAVLTAALGIGANIAIFTVMNAVLLRPLPYPDPDRLVMIQETSPKYDALPVSYPNFRDWQAKNKSFERMGAFRPLSLVLTGNGVAERLEGAEASESFLPTLGVTPAAGRNFTDKEDSKGGERVVLISHEFFERRFNGDPEALGKPLTLSGDVYTVVGVLPAGFRFLASKVDVLAPIAYHGHEESRDNHNGIWVIARLRRGSSLVAAQTDLGAIGQQIEREDPAMKDYRARVVGLRDWVQGSSKRVALMLATAVGLLLLIACVNIANLLLARSAAREREVALRAALGCERSRIVRQLLTESVVLASIGGLVGLLFCAWGVDLLARLVPDDLAAGGIKVDARVLGYALFLSVATGLLFGLIPALRASRTDLNTALKESGRSSVQSGHGRVQGLLIVLEVALSLILLVGAGLMTRSLVLLLEVNPGFDARGVVTMKLPPDEGRYRKFVAADGKFDQQAYQRSAEADNRRLLDAARSVPGVESASLVWPMPLGDGSWMNDFVAEGQNADGARRPVASLATVSPDYFGTMRIPLRQGRFFTERDTSGAAKVVVINDTLRRRVFPGTDPVGKRIGLPWAGAETFTVAGVVADTQPSGLDVPPNAQIYFCIYQWPQPANLAVRTLADAAPTGESVRRAIQTWDKDQPVHDIRTMESRMSESIAARRVRALLMGFFALLALALSAVGIYGVTAYSVAQRTREIGLRMALGADSALILRMVVGRALFLAAAGLGLGLGVSLVLTRLVHSLLYGVTATDPVTFLAVPLVLALVVVASSLVPAWRASRVDPLAALRSE